MYKNCIYTKIINSNNKYKNNIIIKMKIITINKNHIINKINYIY